MGGDSIPIIHTALDDAGYNGTHERHRESVVDVKFKRCLSIVMPMVRQDIQKRPYKVKALPSHIRDLEYRTNTLADKLCGCVDGVLPILDEYRDFPGTRRLQYSSELCDSVLKNVRRTDVYLCYDHHYWNIQCQRDPKVFSVTLI